MSAETLMQRLLEGGCGAYCNDLEREAAAEIDRLQNDILAVRRYCIDVQQSGTANERAVAQTVARMLAARRQPNVRAERGA